jgi:arylsulfatase A-like enzyme
MEGAHNRFDKGPYFYEEVWRIPLIVRRPGARPATQNAYVSILDVGETLFNLAGSGDDDSPARSGRDLLPLAGSSETPAQWPDVAYGVYDLYNGINFSVRAIRDERWKYVWNPQESDELYDLASDPHELVNLIAVEPVVRFDTAAAEAESRLRGQLLAWLREIGDDLPSRVEGLPPAGTVMATGEPGP